MIHLTQDIYLVEVPSDAYDIEILKHKEDVTRIIRNRLAYNISELNFGWIDLGKYRYELLGTTTNAIADFDVSPYVEKHNDICMHTMESQGIFYKCYLTDDFIYHDSEMSFKTLLVYHELTAVKYAVLKKLD